MLVNSFGNPATVDFVLQLADLIGYEKQCPLSRQCQNPLKDKVFVLSKALRSTSPSQILSQAWTNASGC